MSWPGRLGPASMGWLKLAAGILGAWLTTPHKPAISHALKAADEVAAALQAHLIEEHIADPDRAAARSPATDSLTLLRQAREHLGETASCRSRSHRRGRPDLATQPLTSASRNSRPALASPQGQRPSLAFLSTVPGSFRARAACQVCPLPTRIVLSYLTLWVQRSSSQAQLPGGARSLGANGLQPAGQVLSPIYRAGRVTCLEIRWPPGFWFSGPAPSRYSQPRAGRPATECERGRGLSASQARLTPIRSASLRSASGRAWSTDPPVRHPVACSAQMAVLPCRVTPDPGPAAAGFAGVLPGTVRLAAGVNAWMLAARRSAARPARSSPGNRRRRTAPPIAGCGEGAGLWRPAFAVGAGAADGRRDQQADLDRVERHDRGEMGSQCCS